MKINIAASHRFHLLDLARELSDLGHDVRFYSYVPTKRAIQFGLKRECSHSLITIMLPFLAFIKLSKGAYWSIKLSHIILDYYMSWFMRPCDVYIALGTVYKKSFAAAKLKFGAVTILEWGSKHIEEQQRILAEIPGLKRQPAYFTERSLRGYALADYIAIASDHVKQSFIERGVEEKKLIQNLYGVDLSMFRPTVLTKNQPFDLIAVGAWSYQKGYDILVKVCEYKKYRLLHVGSIVDLAFPDRPNMVHTDSVNQPELVKYYAQAKVFVLPSRQDGFAMVQAQAIACGLPIVCSQHTGGRDMQRFLDEKKWVIEMQELTEEELEKCIAQALELAKTQVGQRAYSGDVVNQFTWSAYGYRYNSKLTDIVAGRIFERGI